MREIKIMVIEDSPETRNSLKDIFEMSLGGDNPPCEVDVNGSGEEALEKLNSVLIPNLIILDINLPGMSGGEVLAKLKSKEQWKKIPTIAYSSLWDEKTDLPFDSSLKIVKDYYEAADRSLKTGDRSLGQVTPKFNAQESTSVVHPRLVLFVASILIQQGFELTQSFKMMVGAARRVIGETKSDENK